MVDQASPTPAWLLTETVEVDEVLHGYLSAALGTQSPRSAEYTHLVQTAHSLKVEASRQEAPNHEDAQYFASLLESLTGFVSKMHIRAHERLLEELLGISMWTLPEEVMQSLLRFVVHLMVARGELVPMCHRFLAANLQPPPRPPSPDPQPTVWQMKPEEAVVQDAVIDTLVRAHELMPTLPPLLPPLLAAGVPHKLRKCASQCLYFRGLFELARKSRAAVIREGVIGLAVDHLISLDVEIRWELIAAIPEAEEVDEREELEEDMFELEEQAEHLRLGASTCGAGPLPGLRNGFEGTNPGGGDSTASTSGREAEGLEEAVQKLDMLMEATLQHLEGRWAVGQADAAWMTLLAAFQRTILPTFRAKFTQFLLWHMCSKVPDRFCRAYVEMLQQGFQETRSTPSIRSGCVAYLASFLARAAFLPEPLLLDCLEALAAWCLHYARREERAQRGVSSVTRLPRQQQGPAEQHQVFFAAVQSLLYVLCFRMAALVGASQPLAADKSPASSQAAIRVGKLFRQTIPALLQHRLAPLSFCIPSVSGEFLRLASRLGLLDSAAQLLQQSEAARQARPLEMFFPFDPYLLPRSARLLDLPHTYIRWHAGRPRTLLAAVADADDDDADDADASDVSSDDELPHPGESEEGESGESGDEGNSSGSESEDEGLARRQQPPASSPVWMHRPIGAGSGSGRKRGRPPSLRGMTPTSGDAFPRACWSGDHSSGVSPCGISPPYSRRSWLPAAADIAVHTQ